MNEMTTPAGRVRHEPKLRALQVLRVAALSPGMRRIVLHGEALEGFVSVAPDDHVKLFFPAPGEVKPVLPVMGPNGPQMPEGQVRPVARDYTPRRYDAAAGELTIDFVLHGDGPAARWAAQAAPGQWLGVGGPRGSFVVPSDLDFYLLAGDDSALPAIGRWLEEMRPGTQVLALIEVEDEANVLPLPTAAYATIQWLYRNGMPAGTGTRLLDALSAATLPTGQVHAFIAGEIETVRALRTHLVEARGWAKAQVRAAGYWRIGAADSHARLDD
jgi:NADPH-dependent ferric siderophore reductase